MRHGRIMLYLFPLALVFATIPVLHGQGTAGVNFVAARQFYASQSDDASSPVAADLNGDGRMDFITGSAGLTEFINNGDGTYSQSQITSDYVSAFTVADVNRDGIPDLIYIEDQQTASYVYVALGKGDGTFAAPDVYAVNISMSGSYTSAVISTDFNDDQWPDIVIAVAGDKNAVILYQNQRNGKFVEGALYNVGTQPTAIVAADLNGDHEIDLAVTAYSAHTVTVLWGNGAGAFTLGGTYTVGKLPVALTVGDVNNDGFPDIAVADSNGVDLLLGSSGGTFTAGTRIYEPGAVGVVLADLTGDGITDVAIAAETSNTANPSDSYLFDLSHVSVYPGNGSGVFTSHKVYSIGAAPSNLIAADANGDGHLDLVAGYNGLLLLYGDGFGQFAAAPVDADANATGMTTADFNHDGFPDVAVVNTPLCTAPCGGKVSVMFGTGKNYLTQAVAYPIGMHGAGIAQGDVNGDGIPDLVITNNTAGDTYDLSVLLGNADGTFKPAMNEHLGALSAEVFLADVNNDHKLDLVTDAGVALGKGDGTFGTIIPYPGVQNVYVLHVAVADFNKDGFADIALCTQSNAPTSFCEDGVTVLKGNGTGSFTSWTTADVNYGEGTISALAAADVTGDGYPDIVVAGMTIPDGSGQPYAALIENANGGSFNSPNIDFFSGNIFYFGSFPTGATPGALAIADLNGDGFPDIAMASHASNGAPDSVEVLLNTGHGGPPQYAGLTGGLGYIAAAGPLPSLAIADFNNDHAPDIAVTSQAGVSLLFSQAAVSLSPTGLSWAKVSIGQTGAPKTITITNNSMFPAMLNAAVGGVEANEFRIYTNTCKSIVASGGTCSVEIAFRPTATGKQEAVLTVSQNSAVVANAPLSGVGATP